MIIARMQLLIWDPVSAGRTADSVKQHECKRVYKIKTTI